MQKMRGLSNSTLKLIAVISMAVDHTAAVLLSGMTARQDVYVAYRIMRSFIGRLAFPVFCFLLVEGFDRTRSRSRYAGRLFLFALVSEVPFDLAFYGKVLEPGYQNVFFTLWIGLLMMMGMEELQKRCWNTWLSFLGKIAVFLAAAAVAELICCDYGAKGILAIALLFLFRKNKREQILAGCVAFLWEITAPLAFLPIAFYNGKRGLNLKYIFYVFYPAHLMLLYLIYFRVLQVN